MTHESEPTVSNDVARLSGSGSTRVLLRRWPTWVAIGLTVLLWLDQSEGVDLAPALAGSALVYLAAAILRKPSAAWALFFGAAAVIFATEALGGGVDATWVLLGLAFPLLAYGLWSAATRADGGLLYQAIAMVGFGAAAALALGASAAVGAYLVAGGLFGHAAWDAYHYRANKVVVRSFAELCLVLDALLAVVIVIATV
jgi:hypothetical protein